MFDAGMVILTILILTFGFYNRRLSDKALIIYGIQICEKGYKYKLNNDKGYSIYFYSTNIFQIGDKLKLVKE